MVGRETAEVTEKTYELRKMWKILYEEEMFSSNPKFILFFAKVGLDISNFIIVLGVLWLEEVSSIEFLISFGFFVIIM